jgi:hypothetical protein
MEKSLGQYSVVSYVHQLRGERVNLGVLVWHPLSGCVFRPPKNLSRIRYIDESADLKWIRSAIGQIKETAETWSRGDDSPLGGLAREFRHGLVVTRPLNARVQDPLSTHERLSASLIPPEPYRRASSTRQFSGVFARYLQKELEHRGVSEFRGNFIEEEAFQPIEVTASFNVSSESYLWRAFSFAGRSDLNEQLTLAKSVVAENTVLRSLKKYSDAHLFVAAQMPKPQARAEWDMAIEWLNQASDKVEVFEDRQSLEAKVPDLLPPTLSPTLAS